MPVSPEDRRRREWQREVVKAIEEATPTAGTVPASFRGVERILARMETWLGRNELDDPRVDWALWVQGPARRARAGEPSKTSPGIRDLAPLPVLLDVDALPLPYKRRALAVAARLETVCPDWEDTFAEQRYYGKIPLTTWLRVADLPDAVAFFESRHNPSHPSESGKAWPAPTEEWSHAFARWLINPVTFERRGNDPRVVDPARRLQLFDAAVANGWVLPSVLDRYEWSETQRVQANLRTGLAPGETLVPALLNPRHSGRLIEVLASVDRPGGLFERWRCTTPSWSTWEGPESQTTVWRSLLVNHHPGLLIDALNADPGALDRPVPMGQWFRNLPNAQERQQPTTALRGLMRQNVQIPGVAEASLRAYAGLTLGTDTLDRAMRACPSQADRLVAWWNDPAPRLRDTIELLAHHLLPVASPQGGLANPAWAHQVGGVAERLMLNDALAMEAPPTIPIAPRARARL